MLFEQRRCEYKCISAFVGNEILLMFMERVLLLAFAVFMPCFVT